MKHYKDSATLPKALWPSAIKINNTLAVNKKAIFKKMEDQQVVMVAGQTEIHFLEGSAIEVMNDLRIGPTAIEQLLKNQIKRFPDHDELKLESDLIEFLSIILEKNLINIIEEE